MDTLLASKSLPPGFRFHPTDEELFMFYLNRKVSGKSLNPKMMSELDVYQYGPWDLPGRSHLQSRDLIWYFFSPRSKKYANGGRTNRSTEHGYWKSTGNDRTVKYKNRVVGKIKTLIFHMGKPPGGDRTDWVMHEYRLEDKVLADKGVPVDSYVICKVYKKSGLGPKNGENYCALYLEEEWESDDDDENVGTISSLLPNPVSEGCGGVNNNPSTSTITNTFQSQNSMGQPIAISGTHTIGAMPLPEDDELDRMLAMLGDAPNEEMNVGLDDDFFDGLDDIIAGGYMELNDLDEDK